MVWVKIKPPGDQVLVHVSNDTETALALVLVLDSPSHQQCLFLLVAYEGKGEGSPPH